MNISTLIPKDKSDCSSIPTLKVIDITMVNPILGELLEWIQDMNWPVAKELWEILPRFHKGLIPHIKAVLNSDDDIWKCYTLSLVRNFPIDTIQELSIEIKRIAKNPTVGEILEETNVFALEIIKEFNLNFK